VLPAEPDAVEMRDKSTSEFKLRMLTTKWHANPPSINPLCLSAHQLQEIFAAYRM